MLAAGHTSYYTTDSRVECDTRLLLSVPGPTRCTVADP